MSLTLYYHPLASYCWQALVALYENDTPFTPHLVDLGDAASRTAFQKLWPMGKMPVLRDDARDRTVAESTIIVEYLARYHPGRTALVPDDPDRARDARFLDRFYDLYVHHPMQKIVTDRLRPAGRGDPHGVEEARAQLGLAYGLIEAEMGDRIWATGEDFTMADCAAAPALFYAGKELPFRDSHKAIGRYLDRLLERPAFARTVAEAEPYFSLFPREP
jgi:glutathione S-transferase